jgi:hypothetical protein
LGELEESRAGPASCHDRRTEPLTIKFFYSCPPPPSRQHRANFAQLHPPEPSRPKRPRTIRREPAHTGLTIRERSSNDAILRPIVAKLLDSIVTPNSSREKGPYARSFLDRTPGCEAVAASGGHFKRSKQGLCDAGENVSGTTNGPADGNREVDGGWRTEEPKG